jgi:hypothetical protein
MGFEKIWILVEKWIFGRIKCLLQNKTSKRNPKIELNLWRKTAEPPSKK